MTQRIEISYKTIVFTVFFLLIVRFVWVIQELLYALLLAFIFMSALKPIVRAMVRRKIPRVLSAFLLVISALLLLIFFLGFLIPPIISESVSFFTNLPTLLAESIPFLKPYLTTNSAIQFLPNITENLLKVVSSILSNILFVVSIFFFTFYLLLEEGLEQKLLSTFLESKNLKKVTDIIEKAERRMGAWLRGELILMTVIGLVTYAGLFFLKVPYALSLAFLAGLLEVIPIIGPIVSAVPAFIVAASSSLVLGTGTLVLYFAIQQLENNILVPYIMNKTVGIHPITTLIALSIGGKLGGILGAILAVPVALIIETICVRLLKSD